MSDGDSNTWMFVTVLDFPLLWKDLSWKLRSSHTMIASPLFSGTPDPKGPKRVPSEPFHRWSRRRIQVKRSASGSFKPLCELPALFVLNLFSSGAGHKTKTADRGGASCRLSNSAAQSVTLLKWFAERPAACEAARTAFKQPPSTVGKQRFTPAGYWGVLQAPPTLVKKETPVGETKVMHHRWMEEEPKPKRLFQNDLGLYLKSLPAWRRFYHDFHQNGFLFC